MRILLITTSQGWRGCWEATMNSKTYLRSVYNQLLASLLMKWSLFPFAPLTINSASHSSTHTYPHPNTHATNICTDIHSPIVLYNIHTPNIECSSQTSSWCIGNFLHVPTTAQSAGGHRLRSPESHQPPLLPKISSCLYTSNSHASRLHSGTVKFRIYVLAGQARRSHDRRRVPPPTPGSPPSPPSPAGGGRAQAWSRGGKQYECHESL